MDKFRLHKQLDGYIWFDRTQAVKPLEVIQPETPLGKGERKHGIKRKRYRRKKAFGLTTNRESIPLESEWISFPQCA
jgi:hypothetical protein